MTQDFYVPSEKLKKLPTGSVIVTGASKGIGAEVSKMLSEKDYTVY